MFDIENGADASNAQALSMASADPRRKKGRCARERMGRTITLEPLAMQP
jgi:hypothetical protein